MAASGDNSSLSVQAPLEEEEWLNMANFLPTWTPDFTVLCDAGLGIKGSQTSSKCYGVKCQINSACSVCSDTVNRSMEDPSTWYTWKSIYSIFPQTHHSVHWLSGSFQTTVQVPLATQIQALFRDHVALKCCVDVEVQQSSSTQRWLNFFLYKCLFY